MEMDQLMFDLQDWEKAMDLVPNQCRLCKRKFKNEEDFTDHPCYLAFESSKEVHLDFVTKVISNAWKERKFDEKKNAQKAVQ